MPTEISGSTGVNQIQDGTVSDADISALAASKLTGTIADARFPATLPAASGANLTALPAGNLTGTVADARISALTASKLTGALPAISGANLTGVGVDGITSSANATAITIDSSENVGIGESTMQANLHVKKGDSASLVHASAALYIENSGDTILQIGSPNSNVGRILFSDPEDANIGDIKYTHSTNTLSFRVNDTNPLELTSDGRGVSQFTAAFWARVRMDDNHSVNGSHNVSSVTDRGTGLGTLNFANNLSNANYCVVGSAFSGGGENDQRELQHSNEVVWSTSAWGWCAMDELETVNDIRSANMIGFGG